MSKNIKKTEIKKLPQAIDGEVVLKDDKKREHRSHPITIALAKFLQSMDDHVDAAVIAIPAVAKKRSDEIKKNHEKIDRFVAKINEDGSWVLEAKCAHDVKELSDAIEAADRFDNSNILELIIKSMFIGMFSEYDSFIGDLLTAIYETNPALYKGIKREISLTDLLDFSDISDIKRYMLEKEIDTFRRDSYIEQFVELEKKFEIKNLRLFDEWPTFVEISQRRNLMTHNDGRVSPQYIQVCVKEGVKFSPLPEIGVKLDLPGEYMGLANLTIRKVGFMLAHTIWRKIAPSQLNLSNDAINDSIYCLLSQKRWRAAAAFGEFALTDSMRRGIREMDLKIRIMNHAIALTRLKRTDDAEKLLNSVDWSASIREFALGKAVLEGRYQDAANLMKNIGRHGEILDEIAYHKWPLFDEFRGTVEFQKTYEEIFGVPFGQKVSESVARSDISVKGKPPKSGSKKVGKK